MHGHRLAGRVLVPCGFAAAFTGLWMTQFYPAAPFDGPTLHWIRMIVGILMTLFLGLAVQRILKRDIPSHRAWMIRAYALGIGAGTQVITHIPWFLFPSHQSELFRTICMGAGWGINMIVAEYIIRWPGHDYSHKSAVNNRGAIDELDPNEVVGARASKL